MTGTIRMLSPSKVVSISKDGRAYNSTGGGGVIDAHESDVHALESAGYTPVAASGATAARPSAPAKGQRFLAPRSASSSSPTPPACGAIP